jgi:hypothetical protein
MLQRVNNSYTDKFLNCIKLFQINLVINKSLTQLYCIYSFFQYFLEERVGRV